MQEPRFAHLATTTLLALALTFGTEAVAATCENPQKLGADVRVTSNPAASYASSLVWFGSGYGVAWQDSRDGNLEIYFARLDASGAKVGGDVRVTVDPAESAYPSLVATDEGFAVAWQDSRDGHAEIYFARLDAAGTKVGGDVRVTQGTAAATFPSLVRSGAGYGVAWEDRRSGPSRIFFARLDGAGQKLGSDVPVSLSTYTQRNPALVWTGTQYGVAWGDFRDDNYEIYFAQLDAAGQHLGGDVRVTEWDFGSYYPSLVWTGSGYGVAWQDYRDANAEIYFAQLDALGQKIGPDSRLTVNPASSTNPRLAWSGNEYAVAWTDDRTGSTDVSWVRVDTAGHEIGSELAVTATPGRSEYPSLAWTGNGYGISWEDYRDGNAEIYWSEVACCVDLDGDGWTVCSADCDDANPAIHPGATEICNSVDDNCDGTIDEGFPVPGPAAGLTLAADKTSLTWSTVVPADRYDVVKGDLAQLRAASGSFAASLLACLRDDAPTTAATDAVSPAPASGFYYLVRAQAACRSGTYDDGAGLAAPRDASIAASLARCP